MNAAILCAGLGTRLRPVSLRWPKPALPVLGQPLFRYAVGLLAKSGVTAVVINTHHLPELMSAVAAEECARAGLALSVVHEPVIQGTGGGIRGLRRALAPSSADAGEPFIVFNGDILFAVDLAPIVEAHRASGATATMVLAPMPAGENYAAVELDACGAVVRIAGRGPAAAKATRWHFTGVHVMSPEVFSHMSPAGPEDINHDVYPRMIERGCAVRGHIVQPSETYWSDVGTCARLAGACGDLLAGHVPVRFLGQGAPFGDCERIGNAWVAAGAELSDARVAGPAYFGEGCRLGRAVRIGAFVSIGSGATVGAGAALNRVLVLDGARVGASERLEDCVVLPGEPRVLLDVTRGTAPERR